MFRFEKPAACTPRGPHLSRSAAVASTVSLAALLCAAGFAQTGTSSSVPDASQAAPAQAAPAQASPDQAAPAPAGTPQAAPAPPAQQRSPVSISRSRRINSNRRARIDRNIQDTYSHKWEVAGGGGYLRFRTGQYLQKSNEIGFFASGTRLLNPRWGIVADVRGSYGAGKIPNPFAKNAVYRPNISEYSFTGGAQYRFIAVEKYTVSAVATGGVTLSKFGGDTKGLPSQDLGLWKDSNANPTFTLGANLDYNIYNNLAFRVQPTYVLTTFGSTVQNNLGVNLGVVYRFGRQ